MGLFSRWQRVRVSPETRRKSGCWSILVVLYFIYGNNERGPREMRSWLKTPSFPWAQRNVSFRENASLGQECGRRLNLCAAIIGSRLSLLASYCY